LQSAASSTATEPSKETQVWGQTYWRALYYFNLYRLALGVGLTSIALSGARLAALGERSPRLFLASSLAFAMVAVLNLVTITRGWPRFRTQAHFQFAADSVLITLMAHASGGVTSGLYLLLIVSVAAAGVVLSGRMTVFFAALGTLLAFAEYGLAHQFYRSVEGSYVQVGLIGVGLFSTGLILYFVSYRIRRAEAVSERQRHALADMGKLNELVVAQLDTGVIIVNRDRDVELANATARRLAGAPHEDAAVALRSWDPDLAESFERWANGGPAIDTLLTRPDRPNVAVRFVPVDAAQDQATTAIFMEDLSTTEARVQQEKLAALGRLTAAVAHEIRNPLGAISHAGQLMSESAELGADDRRMIEIINKQSDRINQVVKSILQLGRPGAAQLVELDLGPWLREFSDQFLAARHLPAERISIHVNNVLACTDPDELQQVLSNLCENALRHGETSETGETIRISAGHPLPDHPAYIDVVDNGPGIPRDLADKIFEPFFTTDSHGTGLGLYICRELCEKNYGRLDYIPVDKGSCFRITFAAPTRCRTDQ